MLHSSRPPVQDYLASKIIDRAHKTFVRGLLALEIGDTTRARTLLQQSLDIAGPRYFNDRRIAERYLELLEAP